MTLFSKDCQLFDLGNLRLAFRALEVLDGILKEARVICETSALGYTIVIL